MNLTFGTDPEFFVTYKKDNEDFCVPPVFFNKELGVPHIIPDKKHPVFIKTKSGIVIHQDGAAFEFGIPPFKTAKGLKLLMQEGFNELNDFANKYGYNIYTKPVVKFDPVEFFLKRPEDFRDCVIFGCDRDWDAFNYENYNSDILNVEEHPYRYGGGHLHISGDDLIADNPLPAIHALALTVGNYFIANTLFPEQEKLRAFHYGKPGKFRPQVYPDGTKGIEYRTPSNSWLSLSEEKIEGLLENAGKAIRMLSDLDSLGKLVETFGDETIKSIVNADKKLAKQILSQI